MRSRAVRKTKMISKHSLILCLLLMTILLMGIGYAAINSITGEISGTVIAEQQNDVFITSVEYVSDVDADLANSNIKYYKGTYMQSTVKLSETNPSSEITYKVTVYNNSENTYPFLTTLFGEEFYDNPNIVFEIKDTGFKVGDLINGKETKEIYITFKYKDGVLPENKTLNSNINFKIANPNRLKKAEYGGSTSNYLGSTITRDKIESIKFELGTIQPEGTVASFDASEKQDESIIGYYTDTDANGMYDLTFLSAEPIAPNVNGQYLFQHLSNVKEITFNNFTTYGVTSMYGMFGYCSGLTSLDVTGFDTSKVTNMDRMFSNCGALTELDVSRFNTIQVTNMSYMFWECSGLTNLDVSNFDTSQVKSMSNMFYYCSGLTELDVSNWNTSQVTNMSSMFYKCSGLTELDVSRWNTSQVTDMGQLFAVCENLTNLDVSEWNTSRVTDMYQLFQYCKIEKLDLSKWNTSQVTDMSSMFYYCSTLKSLDVSGFNTSQVTDMRYMFYSCRGLAELDLSSFDTSKVTDMSNMFSSCRGLTSLDVSGFDTSQVTNMSNMFNSCSGLTELDLSKFDTSQVTNMSNMFSSCSGLITIYVSEYDEVAGTGWTTSAVTSSSNMFYNCTKLVGQNGTIFNGNYTDKTYARIDKEGEPGYLTLKVNRLVLAENVDSTGNYLGSSIIKDKIESIKFEKGTTMEAISSFDASEKQDGSVMGYYTDTDGNGMYELTFLSEGKIAPNTNGQYLFQRLLNVKEIIMNNFSTYGVTSMRSMFSYCSKLTELDLRKLDTRQVTNMMHMFNYCSELIELDVRGFNTSQVINMRSVFYNCKGLTSLELSTWNTSQVTDMSYMFYSCSGLTKLDLSKFDTSQVTNMNYMFGWCSGLTSLDLSTWNTSQVTDMSYMFYSCSGLTNLNLRTLNTSQVTDMNYMFSNCSELISLDLSTWITSQVTTLHAMFYGCSKLTELNISNFNTSKVTDMGQMFFLCSQLKSIDVSGFDTSQVTTMIAMFYKCSSLTELDVSGFDTSKVINMDALFSYCSELTTLNLSEFNTSKVIDMKNMFNNCKKLETIYITQFNQTTGEGWTTTAVTSSSNMFYLCYELVGQNGTTYNSEYIDKTYARADLPGTPGYLTDGPKYIPNGYTHIEGTTQKNGYVVEDESGNQYVWVDVPQTSKVYATAGINIKDFTENDYEKIENDLKTYTATYRNNTAYADKYYSNSTTGLTESQYNIFKKKMLKSIYINGGFYIGRYETGTNTARTATGNTTQKPVIKKNAYPYNYVTASQAQALSTEFATDGYVTSLIFGIQWDLTMKYLETKGVTQSELNSKSTNWGNYSDSTFTIMDSNVKYTTNNGATWNAGGSYTKNSGDKIITTSGANETFQKQNIYDLGGNVYEWTLEYTNVGSAPCANRGGNYYWPGTAYPANSRGTGSTGQANDMSGFRTVLYKDEGIGSENVNVEPAYIPNGYTHVAGTTMNNGYVVEDNSGNQYVWVEVPRTAEVYPSASVNITNFTDAEYLKIEADLKNYTSVYRKSTTFTDTYSSQAATGLTETQYNEQKKKMLKSIYKYEGFYIGRYETGIVESPRTGAGSTTQVPVIKENAYPYIYVTNSQAQQLAQTFASTGYTSSLMFGVQWDLVLKYLETKGVAQSELNTNSLSWGNYKDATYNITKENAKYSTNVSTWLSGSYNHVNGTVALITTGASNKLSMQNISDIAGNVWEWTLENSNIQSTPCPFRGGGYKGFGSTRPASYRHKYATTYNSDDVGFRVALYKE